MSLDEKITIIRNEKGQELVQMNMDVFQAIQSYIEDQGLLEQMLQNKDKEEYLELDQALEYYQQLPEAE